MSEGVSVVWKHFFKSSYPRPPQSSRRKSTCPAPPTANTDSTTVWGTLGNTRNGTQETEDSRKQSKAVESSQRNQRNESRKKSRLVRLLKYCQAPPLFLHVLQPQSGQLRQLFVDAAKDMVEQIPSLVDVALFAVLFEFLQMFVGWSVSVC